MHIENSGTCCHNFQHPHPILLPAIIKFSLEVRTDLTSTHVARVAQESDVERFRVALTQKLLLMQTDFQDHAIETAMVLNSWTDEETLKTDLIKF